LDTDNSYFEKLKKTQEGVGLGRKPYYSPEDKTQIVLSVLRGETTQTDVARRLQMSQTTIAKWQKQFLEGGAEGLARGDRPLKPSSKREEELEAQVAELTSALGEAYVELRVFRKGGALYPRTRS
jgi:transposase